MALFAHIAEPDLALYAGRDLGAPRSLAAQVHLLGCPYCRARLERYEESRAKLAADAHEMPAGLDWDKLAAEMTANIHLGLAAGELVRREPRVRKPEVRVSPFRWQVGAVCASVVLVLFASWMMHDGRPAIEPLVDRAVLELPSGATVKTVDFDGAESARQLDGETGQVTITQVYAD